MRLLKHAIIPFLILALGLHGRKTKPHTHATLTRDGQVSAQKETRDRIIGAKVYVQNLDPDNAGNQIDVAVEPSPNNDIPHKTDEELRADAKELEALQASFENNPEEYKGQYTFVTVQDANGNLYYTTNGKQGWTPDAVVRLRAEEMGYNRIHGAEIRGENSNHAEQQLYNALDAKQRAIDNGEGDTEPYRSLPEKPLRLSPSKMPCDQRNPNSPTSQGCGSRGESIDGVSVVGY
ncbi:hypothetical protein [Glycomyces sp. NPDC048151]|uniref:hypothetical protein n=1 Tax=Glycomyces sp. NPDC048151 TaxID=3364002 RepID=UPI003717F2B4